MRDRKDIVKKLQAVAKFCIDPPVMGAQERGPVFRVLPGHCSRSYIALEEIGANRGVLRLERSLVVELRELVAARDARYNGTLVLRCSSQITAEGLIEPSAPKD